MLKELKYKNVKPIYKIDEYGHIYSEYKKGYMKPSKDKDGYLRISLCGEKGIVYARISILVAYNFIGKPPKNIKDPTVDHIDGNILNNHYLNLRWLERGINSSIRKNTGLGELNHEAKLTEKEVKEICDLLMLNNLSLTQIAQKYNVQKSTISKIKRKKNWKYIAEKYSFPKSLYNFGSTNNGKENNICQEN